MVSKKFVLLIGLERWPTMEQLQQLVMSLVSLFQPYGLRNIRRVSQQLSMQQRPLLSLRRPSSILRWSLRQTLDNMVWCLSRVLLIMTQPLRHLWQVIWCLASSKAINSQTTHLDLIFFTFYAHMYLWSFIELSQFIGLLFCFLQWILIQLSS